MDEETASAGLPSGWVETPLSIDTPEPVIREADYFCPICKKKCTFIVREAHEATCTVCSTELH